MYFPSRANLFNTNTVHTWVETSPGGALDSVSGAIDSVGGHIVSVGGAIDSGSGAIDSAGGANDSGNGAVDSWSGAVDSVGGAHDSESGAIDSVSGAINTSLQSCFFITFGYRGYSPGTKPLRNEGRAVCATKDPTRPYNFNTRGAAGQHHNLARSPATGRGPSDRKS